MIDLLVVTSCINPRQQKNLQLFDPEERYQQTIECLKFFIDSAMFKSIVVCDGSGYNFAQNEIKKYSEEKKIELELLSFQQDFSKVEKLGKGYGEGEIMKYIVDNSRLFKKSHFFLKITGRLRVINIKEICQKISSGKVYFNIIPARYIGCVDTRLYGMNTEIYIRYFIDTYKAVNEQEHKSYEYCFTDTIRENKIELHSFPVVPLYAGISGTNNTEYSPDIVYKVECLLTKVGIMNTFFAGIVILVFHLPKVLKSSIRRKNA